MISYLNSVTPITYVSLSFWPVSASMVNFKVEGGQRGLIDLRASPQVKTDSSGARMIRKATAAAPDRDRRPLSSWSC